jgi:hypothetical protein
VKNFTDPKRIRRMPKGNTFRFRGGKLYPAMVHAVRESESGTLVQDVTVELDPIPGRLISQMFIEKIDIFVPVQAMDTILDPEAAIAGNTELVREKLLSSTPLFDLENAGTISNKARVVPRKIGGNKQVSKAVRLAYNCAVNMLRQRLYHRATLVAHSNTAIVPALLAETILDKINGVLDPDDRINGSFDLVLPSLNLPVQNLLVETGAGATTRRAVDNTTGTLAPAAVPSGGNASTLLANKNSADTILPITAHFDGSLAGTAVSLQDFYNAQRLDEFARIMDQMMRDNPQFGEEMVLRWAHGLSVDAGRVPFVLSERRIPVRKAYQMATDAVGIEDDIMRTEGGVSFRTVFPIPKTELGGIIITLICLKPDETIGSQPEPFLTEPWTANNYVVDEMALDPVPVLARDLYSDVATLDETDVVAYTGLNALKEYYVDYGFSLDTDPGSVDAKTAIWQLEIPLSVDPDNVNYPAYLPHDVFPFSGTEAEPADVATCTISSVQSSPTPMIVGPTPIEDIGVNNEAILTEEP